MMTVNEVSKLAGVSVRTLHYYDKIGLLHPAAVTGAGYRQYDDTDLERLQQILLFRELEFPLKEIKKILDSADFDREKALEQQIELLTLKKEHLEQLIDHARAIKSEGVSRMDFKAFDTSKIDAYTQKAKEQWGQTDAWNEFEEKNKNRGKAEMAVISENMMAIFAEFGEMMKMNMKPESSEVQAQVRKLQDYISEHFYQCTPQILQGLGQMYGAGGEFTENIDRTGGEGCAQFTAEAIAIYCR
ncbi:MAG: MerR family transcriptional regulator [Coprococcus sp.]